jgi:hypothetical protein
VKESPRRRRAFAAVLASAVALMAARARATGAALASLDYRADPALADCPSTAEFRQDIVRQLGDDPFGEDAGHRLVIRLYARGARIEGWVEWRDADDQWEGERTFSSRSESCAQLAHTMALAAAIQAQLLSAAGSAVPPEKPIAESRLVVAPPPPPPPPPPAVAPPPPKEPWIAVDAGVGLIQDLGDGPTIVAPRIAVSVGRPSATGVRLAVSGFGPGSQITRPDGVAQIDRFLMTLELVRFFRSGRTIQPLLAIGGGLQDVRARGISAMPSLAAGHEGQVFSGVAAASGGVAFSLVARLSVVLEVEALLFRPAVTIQVGSAQAAHLDGAALFAHGGVLARF